jgi:AhpD family alkylhydroperoxidase
MPRIPALPADKAGFLTRAIYRFAARRYGAVPEPVAVSAHHPGLLIAGGLHELAVQRAATTLSNVVRSLVVYRVAVRLGCSWCVDFGTMLARLDGLDIDRLKQIDSYATSELFTPEERLTLAYADAMTELPVSVTDEQVAELTRTFGRKGVIELTYLIGLENMRARVNSALHITDQGFTSGAACQVPTTADG